jgi:hypothetical protein
MNHIDIGRQARGERAFAEVTTFDPPADDTPTMGCGLIGFVFAEIWTRPGLSRRAARSVPGCRSAQARPRMRRLVQRVAFAHAIAHAAEIAVHISGSLWLVSASIASAERARMNDMPIQYHSALNSSPLGRPRPRLLEYRPIALVAAPAIATTMIIQAMMPTICPPTMLRDL